MCTWLVNMCWALEKSLMWGLHSASPSNGIKCSCCLPAQPIESAVVFYVQHLMEPVLSAFYPGLNRVWPLSCHMSPSLLPPFYGVCSPQHSSLQLKVWLPVERGRLHSLYSPSYAPLPPTIGSWHVWVTFWFGFLLVARIFWRQYFIFTYFGKCLKG